MAFRFSRTELFRNPIHLNELKRIWKNETGRNITTQSPVSVPEDIIFHIYQAGMKKE